MLINQYGYLLQDGMDLNHNSVELAI